MKQRGFTLIEVLVAVGIVGVTLLAGLQASSALTRSRTCLAIKSSSAKAGNTR